MKIIPIYKHEILSLPAEVISEKLSTASREELRVLLAVMTEREFTVSDLAAKLDMTENVFRRCVSFWETAGAFMLESSTDRTPAEVVKAQIKKGKKPLMSSTLPHYSSEEMAELIERMPDSRGLIDSCQQILGKMFNTAETAIILALMDHLSLSPDYILLLCSHAVSKEKKSLRYIEKMALDYFDRDILTYAALEAELNAVEERSSMEYFIRNLFGIKNRQLIQKESDFIVNWVEQWKFSREMIRRAYELTIEKTKDPSFHYANAILERWYIAGLTTIEEVEAAEEKRAANREKNVPAGSSFSTDSFFEAALQRSYGEDIAKK